MKLVILGMSISLLYGQEPELGPKALSVCDLMRQRTALMGQIVTVRGEVKAGGHGAYLIASSTCDFKLITRGVTWPNVVELAYPDNRARFEIFHAPFETDWKSIRQSEGQSRRQGFNPETDQKYETFTGLVVSYQNLEDRVSAPNRGSPNGIRLGFGPVGLDAPIQLLIKNEGDVVVVHGPRK
jgi:hypothetical protein